MRKSAGREKLEANIFFKDSTHLLSPSYFGDVVVFFFSNRGGVFQMIITDVQVVSLCQ